MNKGEVKREIRGFLRKAKSLHRHGQASAELERARVRWRGLLHTAAGAPPIAAVDLHALLVEDCQRFGFLVQPVQKKDFSA